MEVIEGDLPMGFVDMGKRRFLIRRAHIHGYRNDRLLARLLQAVVKATEAV